MAHWFEDLSKTVADEKIGRRTAMRRVAGTVAGAALASAASKWFIVTLFACCM